MDEHFIQSPSNQVIKNLVRLRRAGGRHEQGLFMVEGRRAIDGFIAQGWEPQGYVLAEEKELPASWPVALIYRLSEPAWAKVTTAVNSSGIGALFPLPEISDDCAGLEAKPTLVLVELADPGNVGTLLRSAAAFGWGQVVIVGGADPFAPKVVNASVGAMAGIRLWRCSAELDPTILAAKGRLSALVARAGLHPRDVKRDTAPFILVGNEAHGLPQTWIAAADSLITLPMIEGVESLNAAMAGTVACWALSELS